MFTRCQICFFNADKCLGLMEKGALTVLLRLPHCVVPFCKPGRWENPPTKYGVSAQAALLPWLEFWQLNEVHQIIDFPSYLKHALKYSLETVEIICLFLLKISRSEVLKFAIKVWLWGDLFLEKICLSKGNKMPREKSSALNLSCLTLFYNSVRELQSHAWSTRDGLQNKAAQIF